MDSVSAFNNQSPDKIVPESYNERFEKLTNKAKILEDLIKYYERRGVLRERDLEGLGEINLDFIAQYKEDQRRIGQIFEETYELDADERNKLILKEFDFENLFEGTKPFFIQSENNLVALLDADEYDKIMNAETAGVFHDGEKPLIIIRMVDKSVVEDEYGYYGCNENEVDFSEYYIEALEAVKEELLNGIFDKDYLNEFLNYGEGFPKKYWQYLTGEKHIWDELSEIQEDFDDAIFERMYQMKPYQAWYAENVLNINTDYPEISYTINVPYDYSNEAIEHARIDMNIIKVHEFFHSIFRCLGKKSKEQGELTVAECVELWKLRYAEEIAIYSFQGAIPNRALYQGMYCQEAEFDDEEERSQIIDGFNVAADLMDEINKCIVHSKKYMQCAALFAIEDVDSFSDKPQCSGIGEG